MTEPVPLRVVVVHWNQPEQCRLTVGRFLDREVPVRVTVVDNDSTAANLERLYAGLADLDDAALLAFLRLPER